MGRLLSIERSSKTLGISLHVNSAGLNHKCSPMRKMYLSMCNVYMCKFECDAYVFKCICVIHTCQAHMPKSKKV